MTPPAFQHPLNRPSHCQLLFGSSKMWNSPEMRALFLIKKEKKIISFVQLSLNFRGRQWFQLENLFKSHHCGCAAIARNFRKGPQCCRLKLAAKKWIPIDAKLCSGVDEAWWARWSSMVVFCNVSWHISIDIYHVNHTVLFFLCIHFGIPKFGTQMPC